MKLTTPKRIAVHALLLAGSALFLFPFVWLVVTSLKPIEQTMKMPPEWIPKAYYAPVLGERMTVNKEREIDQPSIIVLLQESRREGERVLLPAEKYQDGRANVEIRIADRKVQKQVAAEVEKRVPPGSWLVREKIERLPQETPPLTLPADHVTSWPRFCARLYGERAEPAPNASRRLWSLLPQEARQIVETAAGAQRPDKHDRAEVAKAVTELLARPDLFPQELVAELEPPAEAKTLLRRRPEELSDQEVRRMNRLLLEAAFPKTIAPSQEEWLTPRWDCVDAAAIVERAEPAWWNYQGAIRYTGYYPLNLFGWSVDVPMFIVYLWNTMVVAVLGTIGLVISSSLAAYGFSRICWKGRDTCFFLTLCTMMVPFAVIMVPLYGVFRSLGWIGTLRPLWVPPCFGHAFSIFLLRQFFLTIPQDLTDAARIDGCSEFGIFWRVILPLSKPALAVVALFHFMYAWKDFLGPLIFLTEQHTYTLSLGLQFYQSQHGGSEWHFLMAAATMMILPVVILFFFTQRTFIQGISTTGMKG